MKKHFRTLLFVVLALTIVFIASRIFVEWSLDRAFRSSTNRTGGLQKVVDAMEASLGSTLARGDVRLKLGNSPSEGALSVYQEHPQSLQNDKKYFETWVAAVTLIDAGRAGEHQSDKWESSTAASWIPPTERVDAWGHAFCIRYDYLETIVVSPGPKATGSLDCKTIEINPEELSRLPTGRLYPLASGALILTRKNKIG